MIYSNLPKSKLGCHASLEQFFQVQLDLGLLCPSPSTCPTSSAMVSFHSTLRISKSYPICLSSHILVMPMPFSHGQSTYMHTAMVKEPILMIILFWSLYVIVYIYLLILVILVFVQIWVSIWYYFSSFPNNFLNMNCIALSSINVYSENSFIWCISQGSPVKQKQQVIHTERERFSSRNCLIQPWSEKSAEQADRLETREELITAFLSLTSV